ncbi:L-serine deaminase [Labilithrix luteola]|uniref:L-serine deaminase n=1 Tax=Labilithrix luteola TaxID=1391654 RepID=A0A0K1PVF7_9BACT|nr:hypothetical protein [Labilithrix luteola]AKU97351.1 L-serine deaminase [Labilithrix luteola]
MSAVRKLAQAARIASRDLSFEWDERNVIAYYRYLDEDVFERIDPLTGKANLGLTIAAAEWLVERFSACHADVIPQNYLAAAWAGAAHPAYCAYMETSDDDWRGPVRGPLAMAMSIVNDAMYGLSDHPNVALRACWMHNLVTHVLPDTEAFEDWWEACVDRLEQVHAIDVELAGREPDLFDSFPDQGAAVPPQAFDPAQPYHPLQAWRLWDEYLQALAPATNPTLPDPTALDGIGDLPGPPYRYRPGAGQSR